MSFTPPPERISALITAQNVHTEHSGQKRYPIPAQNVHTEHSGRIWPRIPAQAATIFHSRRERHPIPAQKSATEDSGRIWPRISRAGGYIFPFRAKNDTPFPRRTLPRSIPGGFGHGFPAQAATFFLSTPKMIPLSRAERCLVAFRAEKAAHSRVEWDITPPPWKEDCPRFCAGFILIIYMWEIY